MRIKLSGFSSEISKPLGFQRYWSLAWLWTDRFSLCIKSWSQYLPPSVRCFQISWYRELWKSLLLRFIHYLAKPENLTEANYCPLSLASLLRDSGSLKTML